MQLRQLSSVDLTSLAMATLTATPLHAQASFCRVLQTTSTSDLVLAPYTIGSVIRSGSDRIYKFRAIKGDTVNITISSVGTRTMVTLFDSDGKAIKNCYGAPPDSPNNQFAYTIPKTGDYYLFCYSGPTNHFYNSTIVVD
ncbi:MAG: PPC domain-containing protein [Cyanobacteria bacterium]|nr:PPC domain-containing protein [Cyanobacteriota bacterium]MDW8201246.1 PPC domain-containing protein [Cyanobacteriota bacterium SKYGB_h_bin112]